MGRSHYVFEPNDEAVRIITAIMDANFLDPNFTIKSGDVDNALATFENGERYIIYNTAYIERIKNSAGSDWAAYFVFAHEIGHHLSNHHFDISDADLRKEQELKADIFAGGMLFRLGASLDEAQSGVATVCNEKESDTHPPRRARMEAVASGWRKAKDKSPVQPKRVVLPSEPAIIQPTTKLPEDPMGLVPVTGSTFTMGCTDEQQDCDSDEKPAHRVKVSDFYIGKYEVTQQLWREIMGTEPSYFKNCEQCPVEQVSWEDVQEFLQKLNTKYPGRNYRLPTEAEWEFAAREGGKEVLFGNGKNTANPKEINYDGDADVKTYSVTGIDRSKTTPVGSFSPNALGLYDMSGNVYEWCSDWKGAYPSGTETNPTGPTTGSFRVFRGGSWGYSPQNCRVAYRDSYTPGNRNDDFGFRLARTK